MGSADRSERSAAVDVPDDFATDLVNHAGEAGRAWVASLPSLVDDLCRTWGLIVDGAPMHGYLGLVVPVVRGAEQCVLKVSWPDESTVQEINALRAWAGRGMVRLLEADENHVALLLEWLDSRRALQDVPVDEAVAIAGDLIRRLAVPAPSGLPRLPDVARRIASALPARWDAVGRPMAREILDAASDVARQLGPSSALLLVDFDLHYGNVLAGAREPWLAIDPKVIVGDPEYGVAQLLWTRLEDLQDGRGLPYYFHALIDRAGLNRDRTVAWTLLRCVDYWLWARSVGLTTDPARCEIVVNELCI